MNRCQTARQCSLITAYEGNSGPVIGSLRVECRHEARLHLVGQWVFRGDGEGQNSALASAGETLPSDGIGAIDLAGDGMPARTLG